MYYLSTYIPSLKKEEAESLNHIKLEPEAASSNVGDVTNGAKSPTTAPDDADFLDRLLDDLEYPVKAEIYLEQIISSNPPLWWSSSNSL